MRHGTATKLLAMTVLSAQARALSSSLRAAHARLALRGLPTPCTLRTINFHTNRPTAKMPGPAPGTEDDVCVDCQEGKQKAQVKEEATQSGHDGLRLGDCKPLYRDWADCVEKHAGQASACAAVLAEFKQCHKRVAQQNSVTSLLDGPRRR